jgi:hypothetical protein
MLKLYKKIDAVQKEIGSLRKDGKNPHFGNTYVTKDSLLDQIRPYFEKHNLLLIQPPQGDRLETRIICLDSGEELSSSINFPPLTDPQKILSCVTYFCRGILTGILGLPAEDDDGNQASGKKAFLKNNTQDYASVIDYINTDPKPSLNKLKIRFAMTKEMEDQLTKLINLNNK